MAHDDGALGLDAPEVKFDDERAVSDAVVVLVATLAGRLQIEALAGEPVRLRRARRTQGDGADLRGWRRLRR